MKNYYFEYSIIIILSLSFGNCIGYNKNNKLEQITILKDNDSIFQKGVLNHGVKVGVWGTYNKTRLLLKTKYVFNKIKEELVEEREYYSDSIPYLIETAINEQVVNLEVKNNDLFKTDYLLRNSKFHIGSDLFLYYCAQCHKGHPIMDEDFRSKVPITNKETVDILCSLNHLRVDSLLCKDVNSFEIELIINYIKEKPKHKD